MPVSDIPWLGLFLIISGMALAVIASRLVRVLMDILEAKKMQKNEHLQPLLGVVSPNFDKIVEHAKKEDETKDVKARTRKR